MQKMNKVTNDQQNHAPISYLMGELFDIHKCEVASPLLQKQKLVFKESPKFTELIFCL